MAQGKPKRYSDEHLKLLEAGVVVYPGDESLIQRLKDQATKVKTVITETDFCRDKFSDQKTGC